MRKMFSTLILAFFLLISAFANFGSANAVASEENESQIKQVTVISSSAVSIPLSENTTDEDECPCKNNATAKQFTCGVSLALATPCDVSQLSVFKSIHAATLHTTGMQQFIEQLKKPPRSKA